VYRLHQPELDSIQDEEQKYRRLVELNVEEQCFNVIKTSVIQQSYAVNHFPIVHGWVFDVRSGELIDLKINFEDKLHKVMEIYNLGLG
jgi:carbonic anhydrase